MKFDCDRRYRRRLAEYEAISKWHRYFAIWPVRVGDGDCRWMEYVERRVTYDGPDYLSPLAALDNSWLRKVEYRAIGVINTLDYKLERPSRRERRRGKPGTSAGVVKG